MSDQNFVSTNGGVDVVSAGSKNISEPTLNTSALKEAAKAFLSGTPASSEQPAAQEPVSPIQQIPVKVSDVPQSKSTADALAATQAQQPETSDQKVTVTDPATGTKTEIDLLAIPDDAIVRVKRDGQVVTVTGKEAKQDVMRAAKFTHEMQQLRKREEEHAARLERAGTLEQLVTDDVALASYIYSQKPHIVEELARHMGISKAEAAQAIASEVQKQPAAQPQAQPFAIQNPAELASLGEVDSLLSQRASALEQHVLAQVKEQLGGVNSTVTELVKQAVGEHVKQEIQQLRHAGQIASFNTEITKTVGGILDKNPALKAVPNIEHLLRFEASKMKPQSFEETQEALEHVAAGIVEGLETTYNTARKTTVIDKATMEKTGIEPPVGTQPTFTRPLNYEGENGKVDFNKIREAAKAALRTA